MIEMETDLGEVATDHAYTSQRSPIAALFRKNSWSLLRALLTFWNLFQGGKKRNTGQPHNAFGLLLMSTADTNGEWRTGEGINLPLPGMPAPYRLRVWRCRVFRGRPGDRSRQP
jgi:hypothetical protein